MTRRFKTTLLITVLQTTLPLLSPTSSVCYPPTFFYLSNSKKMGFVLFDILLVYRYVGRWIPNLSSRLGFDHCQWYPSLYFPALSFFLFLGLSEIVLILVFFWICRCQTVPKLDKVSLFSSQFLQTKRHHQCRSSSRLQAKWSVSFSQLSLFLFFVLFTPKQVSYHYSLTLLLPTRSRVWSATLAGVLNELEKKDRERRWVFIL